MKKYLIVLAAAVIALASCNKKEDTYTSISFKEANRTLTIGEQVQFNVLWEPATLAEPACTWESSDTTVLQVDANGIVSAVYLGEANIIATYKDLHAVCHVTVEQYEQSWAPSATIYYFPSTKSEAPISDSVYIMTGGSGAEYECQMYTVSILGLNSLEFDGGVGEGDCIFATISALFITKAPAGKESFVGQVWDIGLNIVSDSATFKTKDMSAFAGQMDPAIIGPAYQAVLEAIDAEEEPDFDTFVEDYAQGVSGAAIVSAESSETGASWSPLYSGIVTQGHIYLDYDAATEEYVPNYDLYLQWCYGYVPNLGYTGLATNLQTAQSWSEVLVQPFELDLSTVWRYQTGQKGTPLLQEGIAPSRAPRINNALKMPAQEIKPLIICKDRPAPVANNK